MKYIRNQKIFLAICMLFIVLSACNRSEPQSQDISQNSASNSQQIQTGAEKKLVSDPKEAYVTTTLSSGVEVNANIEISDYVNIDQLSNYDAQIVKQDYELLKQLLLANKEIVEEESSEMAEARTDALFHYCVTSDGSSLAYTGEGFTYESGQYTLMQNILYSKEVDISQFSDKGNLSFATREDAQLDIENTLEQLKLTVEEKPICLTLSFESLQSICEKINATQRDYLGQDSPLYTPLTCNASDACYIYIYQVTVKGLPISTHANGVFGDGSWTSGTSLYCFYSEKGIVGMELPYTFQVTGQTSPTVQGLTASQVLEKLDNKFNSMILSGDYQVTKIEFEYVPKPINGSRSLFQLIPAWRISIFHTYQYQDEKNKGEIDYIDEQFDVVFNAITGEELINSSGSV